MGIFGSRVRTGRAVAAPAQRRLFWCVDKATDAPIATWDSRFDSQTTGALTFHTGLASFVHSEPSGPQDHPTLRPFYCTNIRCQTYAPARQPVARGHILDR